MSSRPVQKRQPLTHDEVRFLREVCLLRDHNGASEEESAGLRAFFERACEARGVDPATLELVVEALC